MRLYYGTYGFVADQATIAHTREDVRADTGLLLGFRDMWKIRFWLTGDNQAAITTEINNLYAAFSVQGRDLVLKDNNSANSAFLLRSNLTTSGTRIRKIAFDELTNAAYAPGCYVTGTIEADAETSMQLNQELPVPVLYAETFQVRGTGGPKIVILETATGLPIIQQTRSRTMVTAVQSGSAKYYGAIPSFPPYLFPNLLIHEDVVQSVTSEIERNKYAHTISWSYPYQGSTFFSANPIVRV